MTRHRHIIIYGIALAGLLLLLKWLEWRFVIFDHAFEVYSGAIAVIFTGLGIWLALKLARPSTARSGTVDPTRGHASDVISATRHTPDSITGPNLAPDPLPTAADLGLSNREVEVLQLMAEGLSNQEIAARLYVSINTIKTHSSNIFEKMDVRRRTQAIDKAKKLNIIR